MFVYKFFYSIFSILSLYLSVNAKDYCDPKFCGDKIHNLCKNKNAGPASKCVNYERFIKSDADKQDILNKLNSRRNKVASGDIRSLPPAEDMMKLEWNEDLADSAQRWADQCEGNSNTTDSCRDLENTAVGQNIATLYGEAPRLRPSTLVDLWYMELLNINPAVIYKYQRSSTTDSEHYDYFTQLIWSETRFVGCGAVKYQEQEGLDRNRTVFRLVCNFMPSGNVEAKRVYNDGPPCSHCPFNEKCDTTYSYLCGTSSDPYSASFGLNSEFNGHITVNFMINNTEDSNIHNTTKNLEFTVSEEEDSDIAFDSFTQLLNFDNNTTTPQAEITRLCKDALAVNELMDVLRKKLSTDNVLKELLFSTKSPNSDGQYSDAKIDAIVSKIYSKKTTSTTPKSTENDTVNSTLLVDLVEAVIFRNRDKISTTEDNSLTSGVLLEARTVVMQAELGEVKQNVEFTGHYFFPEEEDREEQQIETTESYYDSTVPVSEIVLEIENLKRNDRTKDFLDEILDSDYYSETAMEHIITSPATPFIAESEKNLWNQTNDFDGETVIRSKRSMKLMKNNNEEEFQKKNLNDDDNILISYKRLLKILARDLKDLKLNDKFQCSHSSAGFVLDSTLIMYITCIRFIIN